MATLADAFLHDFESGSEDEEEVADVTKLEDVDDDDALAAAVVVREIDLETEDETSAAQAMDIVGADSVDKIASLLENEELKEHLATIDSLGDETMDFSKETLVGVTRDVIYDLIVKSNEFNTQLDNEILLVHKFTKDLYATKLKDLEQVVVMPVDYAHVVKAIGNEMDLTRVDLTSLLPQNVILTITVTASAATGKPLPPEQLKKVMDACDAMITLNDYKVKIFKFVESCMELIAPNLSAIVGTEIAARLIGLAGGLEQLSKMPSCNMQVLGHLRADTGGFSALVNMPHMGILAHTDLIMMTPNDLKQRAMRLVAAKCALAARVDHHEGDPDGGHGRSLRETIEKKITKWQEPPPPKVTKALPKPDMRAKRKRGGRKYRKQRELTRQTELQKQKNRMMFNVAQKVDEYTGEEYGMIGVAGSGYLRTQKKTKQKAVGKAKRAKLQKVAGASSGRSGFSSTIALTPVQGIELVNPNAKREAEAKASKKYFSTTSGFRKVGKNLPPVPSFDGSSK